VVPHGAAEGDGGGRTRLLAVAGTQWRTVLRLLLPLSPSFIFFLFCFSLSLSLSLSLSFSFLFSLLCYVFFSFFSFGLPAFFLVFLFCGALLCIYRKNMGERGRGGHCAAAPKTARRACSLIFHRPVVGHRSEVIHMELWLASF